MDNTTPPLYKRTDTFINAITNKQYKILTRIEQEGELSFKTYPYDYETPGIYLRVISYRTYRLTMSVDGILYYAVNKIKSEDLHKEIEVAITNVREHIITQFEDERHFEKKLEEFLESKQFSI